VEVLEAKALLSGGGLEPEIFRILGGSTRFDQIDLAKTGIVFAQQDTVAVHPTGSVSRGRSPALVNVVAVFTRELTNQVAGLGGAALPQSGGVIASESYQARRDHVRFDLRSRSPDGLVFDQHSTIGLHRVGPGHAGHS
jgi:hypothetical protein